MLILVRHANEIKSEVLNNLQKDGVQGEIVFPAQVRQWLAQGKLWGKFKTYSNVFIYAPDSGIVPNSPTALAAALFMGKKVYSIDAKGFYQALGYSDLLKYLFNTFKDKIVLPFYLKKLDKELGKFEALSKQNRRPILANKGSVCYLRPDLIAGLTAGGSVGHVAGVINNLAAFGYDATFFSVEKLPLVETSFYEIRPENRKLWSQEGLPAITFSPHFAACVQKWVTKKGQLAFIYQRHGLNTWAGAQLALTLNCPFVLEYNGSEVWVAKHWGTPITREEIALRLEALSLAAADLIVVISQPLADELIERGFEAEKILVNPNGVNIDFYHPAVNAQPIISNFNLENKLVVGFIGTFGRWHGAEKLAEAWGMLLARCPDLKTKATLLFIGDGLTVQETKDTLARWQVEAIFTGTVPQAEGPAYLAACDILVAPHVPNADNSKFFGSPTKLFEYMAMGKAIVSSDLDQLGEVIEHEKTGLLAMPGDANDLSYALERLLNDKSLRETLGRAARKEAESKHTWKQHTTRILNKLKQRCT